MALLPSGGFAIAGLLLIVAGVAVLLRRDVPKAYGAAGLIMAAFLLDTVAAVFGGGSTVQELGFQASRFFAGEAWWSPLTSVFTHSPTEGRISLFNVHAFGNILILITAGPPLEERMGGNRFLILFFVAAAFALVVHVALAYLTPITFPGSLAIGASGGIFGILTAFAVRYPREPLPMLLLFFFVTLPASIVLLMYLGFNIVYMFTSAGGIAWWGHFAGVMVGLAWAARLPEHEALAIYSTEGAKGLPDPKKLEPLATTPQLRGVLEKIRQFTPENRTRDDLAYADAWLGRFFAKATCPACGKGFVRKGLSATCESGETTVDFARA